VKFNLNNLEINPTFVQLVKFGGVGLLNTCITLGIIYVLMSIGVDYLVANFVGYVLGLVNSFVWNKLWIFKVQNGALLREIILFLAVFGVCYALQMGALVGFVKIMGVPKSLAQCGAMVIYTGLNFVLNKLVIFKK
jgi:putative flippase GtrA